jgi:hypothetical protein
MPTRWKGAGGSAERSSAAATLQATLASDVNSTAHSRGGIGRRMLRVLRFDASVYVEIERDPSATRQAAGVVALVAAAAALGTVLLTSWHPGAILGAMLAALLHWLVWSGVEGLIGRVLFRRRISLRQHVRALGFAQTPQLLALFAFVPAVGHWTVVASRLLTMLAGNQALVATLEIKRRQAIAIRLVSFGIALVVAAGVRAALGDVPFLTALLRP